MKLTGYVALCERDVLWGSDGDNSERDHLNKPKRRWGDNIEMGLQEMRWNRGLD
jgi:hypothetical protein